MVKWYDLTKWILERVDSFPKNQRFVFGQRLADQVLDILELLVEASYSDRKAGTLATAARLVPVVARLQKHQDVDRLLAGFFPVRILDGNHLAATEHRIGELRDIAAGPRSITLTAISLVSKLHFLRYRVRGVRLNSPRARSSLPRTALSRLARGVAGISASESLKIAGFASRGKRLTGR